MTTTASMIRSSKSTSSICSASLFDYSHDDGGCFSGTCSDEDDLLPPPPCPLIRGDCLQDSEPPPPPPPALWGYECSSSGYARTTCTRHSNSSAILREKGLYMSPVAPPPPPPLQARRHESSSSSSAAANLIQFQQLFAGQNTGKVCSEDAVFAMMVALDCERQEEERRRREEAASAKYITRLMREEAFMRSAQESLSQQQLLSPEELEKKPRPGELLKKKTSSSSPYGYGYGGPEDDDHRPVIIERLSPYPRSSAAPRFAVGIATPSSSTTSKAAVAPPLLRTSSPGEESTEDLECLVCLRTACEYHLTLRKLPCNHHFCSECIDRWLAKQSTCPYCRQNVRKTKR